LEEHTLKFIEFGWNGFNFEIPEDLRFTREGGDAKTGYMRFSSDRLLLELRWQSFKDKKPKKVKPIEEVADDLLKKIEKSVKRKIHVKRKSTTFINQHNSYFMSLKTNFDESIYLWCCEESGRIIICRFMLTSPDEDVRDTVERMVNSMKCHSEGSNVWSIMGFRFEAPNTFMLTDRKITLGRAHILLSEQKLTPFTESRREVLVEYFSMANVRFKDYKNPKRWFEKNYMKELKRRYRGIKFQESKPRRFRGHIAYLRRGVAVTGLTTRRSSLYTNLTWYCSNLNRIYTLTLSSHISRPVFLKRTLDEDAFENFVKEVTSSVRCHI